MMNALRFPRSSAVMGEGAHAGEVAHFGNPLREQRLLATGRAVADLSAVRVLTLTGPDALTWLNTLTTQKVDTLAAGESTETLVLSPTGHIEHWLRVHYDGQRLWLLTDGDAAAAREFLESMRFMLRVEIVDAGDEYQCVGVDGEVPDDLPATVVWDDPWPDIGAGSASYALIDSGMPVASPEHPGTEHDFRIAVCLRTALAEWDPGRAGTVLGSGDAGERGFEVAGRDAWDALQIEAWRPGVGEVDHKSLVGELDVLRTGVHLAKGCYRGQEAVARIHNLGQPPRRLVFLHLDGSGHTLPEPDAEVRAEVRGSVRPVGRITSVALHHELGPIALALVKRSLPSETALFVEVAGEEQITSTAETIVVPQREHRQNLPQANRDVDQRRR